MIPSNQHLTVQSILLDPKDIRSRCFSELIMMFYLRYVFDLCVHHATSIKISPGYRVIAYMDVCLRNEPSEISYCSSWRVCSLETGSHIPVVHCMCICLLRDGVTSCVRVFSPGMAPSWTSFTNGNTARLIISADLTQPHVPVTPIWMPLQCSSQ